LDAQTITKTYEADATIFPNPERGFYHPYSPPGGGIPGQQDTPHPPFLEDELRALRQRAEGISLIRDCILIPRKFWDEPISQEYLDGLQVNFDAVRAAGLKTAVRFLYDWGMLNRDPDEATIMRHLDELAPLIRKNYDVIAWMDGGFFGGTGEGCHSDHGYVYERHFVDSNQLTWQGLSPAGQRILLKELQILPVERMLTLRYPRLKWDLFDWNSETAMQNALTPATAFSQQNQARVGFQNDGFMGSPEHYAMFRLPNEANFAAQDSEFVLHHGEISDASPYKLQDNQVAIDMKRYHQTALNCAGDGWPEVSQAWKDNNDYDDVARYMGYRFRLEKATLPQQLTAGADFTASLTVFNEGWASAMNPRGLEVILRNYDTGEKIVIPAAAMTNNDPRRWRSGESSSIDVSHALPAGVATGQYDVLLNLPDPLLSSRAEYSIRLANQSTWESDTGYNSLQHSLVVN
jgi:hypothetical protein